MKKIILSLSLLLYAVQGFAQLRTDAESATKDSLLVFIGKIKNGSFGILHNGYATDRIYFDRNARSIIKVLKADNSKRVMLLSYLEDKEKVVTIHAILTKLYDKSKFHLESAGIYNKEPPDINSELLGERFWLNGLEWEERDSKDLTIVYFVAEDEIIKVEKFWRWRFSQSKIKRSNSTKPQRVH